MIYYMGSLVYYMVYYLGEGAYYLIYYVGSVVYYMMYCMSMVERLCDLLHGVPPRLPLPTPVTPVISRPCLVPSAPLLSRSLSQAQAQFFPRLPKSAEKRRNAPKRAETRRNAPKRADRRCQKLCEPLSGPPGTRAGRAPPWPRRVSPQPPARGGMYYMIYYMRGAGCKI